MTGKLDAPGHSCVRCATGVGAIRSFAQGAFVATRRGEGYVLLREQCL